MRVVLNALPPARIDTPSAPLSILKAFLVHHDVKTEIIYWNLLLDGLPPAFERNTDVTHLDLLPYLYLVAGRHDDAIACAKANAYMKAQIPLHDILNDASDYLAETGKAVDEAVAGEFARYSRDERLLFGISCKYEQWIPGIVLAGHIKRYFPDSRIVLGGFRDSQKAESVLKMCGDFDFAIRGEGEYLLKIGFYYQTSADTYSGVQWSANSVPLTINEPDPTQTPSHTPTRTPTQTPAFSDTGRASRRYFV